MKRPALLAGLTLALAAAGCANLDRSRDLADPAVAPAVIARQVCSTCHGVDGNPVSPAYPRLAGQTVPYLSQQLRNFRGHGRSDPAGSEYMWGLSAHLSDAQITGLAEYYAGHAPIRSTRAPAPAALLASGREIFEKGIPDRGIIACVTCHGAQAQGNETFPRLAWQHADYIRKQLDIFQDTHGGRPDTPMAVVAQPLSAEAKDAVAAYLEAMPD